MKIQCNSKEIVLEENALLLKFEVNIRYGLDLLQKGEYNQALNYFIESIHDKPKNNIIWNIIGVIYFRQGNFFLAKHCFLKALQGNPIDLNARKNLEILLESKNHQNKVKVQPDLRNILASISCAENSVK